MELRAFEAMQAVMPLLRWLDERNAVEAGHNHSGLLCRKVEKYLRENLDKNVTVQEIAASLYLSPHYLGSVFHQRTKMTIKQYQMRLKMEAAITMMRDSELSVGDVSSGSALSHPSISASLLRITSELRRWKLKNVRHTCAQKRAVFYKKKFLF